MYSMEEIEAQYPYVDHEKSQSLQDFSSDVCLYAADLIERGFSIEYADQMQKLVWSREAWRVQEILDARERECKYFGMTPREVIDLFLAEEEAEVAAQRPISGATPVN